MVDKVSVLKCKDYNPGRVRKVLLESLRNINFDLKKLEGKKVLIKPNLLSANKPEDAITTHPVVVEELCKILKENKVKEIIIGESSAMNTDLAFKTSGLANLSKYAKIINFEGEEKVIHDFGERMHRIPLPKILFQADLVINMAKMKTHGLTFVTLCVKNLYGCIPGGLKGQLHNVLHSPKKFSHLLFNIEKTVKPELNIIDGVTGIEGNGPGTSGDIIKPGLIIAGNNARVVDFVTSEIMGFNPNRIYTIKYSHINKKSIIVIGERDIKVKFKKPSTAIIPFFNFMITLISSSNIEFDKSKCKKCHLCEQKCPRQAISLKTKDKFPVCDHKKCIKCLCCVEVCPNRAIYMKDSFFIKWAKKVFMVFMK